jgi:hypothetical protein
VASGANDYRPLKFNEVVYKGDFVADGRQGFKLWDGPRGFRADAFIETIYRRKGVRARRSHKTPVNIIPAETVAVA